MSYKNDYQRAQDRISNILLSVHRDVRTGHKQWEALYYSQPHAGQAATLYAKRFAALRTMMGVIPGLEEAIKEAVRIAGLVVAEKEAARAAKDARQGACASREPREGTYAFPKTYVAGVEPMTGDFILVNYGNGSQLAYVLSTTPKTLTVARLYARGTASAHWRRSAQGGCGSKLNRNDSRILGISQRVAQDPIP